MSDNKNKSTINWMIARGRKPIGRWIILLRWAISLFSNRVRVTTTQRVMLMHQYDTNRSLLVEEKKTFLKLINCLPFNRSSFFQWRCYLFRLDNKIERGIPRVLKNQRFYRCRSRSSIKTFKHFSSFAKSSALRFSELQQLFSLQTCSSRFTGKTERFPLRRRKKFPTVTQQVAPREW